MDNRPLKQRKEKQFEIAMNIRGVTVYSWVRAKDSQAAFEEFVKSIGDQTITGKLTVKEVQDEG